MGILAVSSTSIVNVNDGSQGPQGLSISTEKEQWYLSSSKSSLSGGSWSYTEPTTIPTGKYLWGRLEFTMTDGSKQYSDAVYRSVIDGVVSKVDNVDKKITDKIWESDIDSKISAYDGSTAQSIRDRVTSTEQDLNGIHTSISSMQTSINNKADSSTVTTLSSKVNTIENTTTSHTQQISSLNTTISNKADTSTVTALESRVSTVEQDATGFRQTVESTYTKKSDFDALKIGTRNYLDNSEKFMPDEEPYTSSTTTYNQSYVKDGYTSCNLGPSQKVVVDFPDDMVIGNKYIFSFEWCRPWDERILTVIIGDKTTQVTTVNDNNWHRQVIKFTATATTTEAEIGCSTASRTMYLRHFQLEEGTLESDWHPSENDMRDYTDSSIVTAKSEIKQTTDSISTEVSKKVGASEIISKINQSPETIQIQASKVNLVGSVSFDMLDSNTQEAINATGSELIIGTQTASTSAWTGKSSVLTGIKSGTTINYKLPYASTSTAVTLNLTYKDNKTSGAKAVYFVGTTRVTTQYGANAIVQLTYDGTAWRVLNPYTNSNTYDRVKYTATIKAGNANLTAGKIIVANVNNVGTYTNLAPNVPFDIAYPILYNAGDVAVDATSTNTYLAMPFNLTTTQSGSYVSFKPVYVKGKLSGTKFTPVSGTMLTQQIPTTNDGYQYLFLGTMYSTTNIYLVTDHPIYMYHDGSFKSTTQIASEASVTANEALDKTTQFILDNETIIGTQTANTGAWTGNSQLVSLVDGQKITYWLPYAYSSSVGAYSYTPTGGSASNGASLELQLKDGTSTGKIPCFYGGTDRLTDQYGAGNSISMTYRENVTIGTQTVAKGWWANANYNTNTVDNLISYFSGKTGAKGIWAWSLFMRDGAGTYQNICTASDGQVTNKTGASDAGVRTTANTKLRNTSGFEVNSQIWTINTSYGPNSNISGKDQVFSGYGNLIDSRYSLNTTLTAGSLTAYKPVYLVGTIGSDGLYYLDSTWWTQTATDASKVYVLLGNCYDSTTSNCRITLFESNPWVVYRNGKLVDYNTSLAITAQDTADLANDKATKTLGMKVNYSTFTKADPGEVYLHGYQNGVPADIDGYVYWNEKKVTVQKGMLNPNAIISYLKTVFIVLRLSSATATSGTLYMVWWDEKWKYASTPTPSAVGGDWTWTEDRDVVIGQFIPTATEGQVIDAYLYEPPRNASHITSTGGNPYTYSQSAVDWVKNNGPTQLNATEMLKVWTGGAISQTTTVQGGWIATNTITSAQLATDAIMSNGYQASTNKNSPYSAIGTYLDLSNGNFWTPNFGIINMTPDGTTIPIGAYFNGHVDAGSGKFGTDSSYWNIETVYDYYAQPHAALVGTGSPYLQTGNWQVSDNAVATRKYVSTDTTTGSVSYYKNESTYYDMGMKLPTVFAKNNDSDVERYNRSLLYIRKYSGSVDVANVIDDEWTYPFMVDSDGRVYATDIIITGGGQSSTYLPLSGGTINGNLTVTGTLNAKASGLTKSITVNGQKFDGSANVVVGTLGVGYGGTGKTTFASGEVLVGNGTGAIATRGINDITKAGDSGWGTEANRTKLITTNTLSYWNGRYNSTQSNLEYVKQGKLGNIVTHNVSEFITTSGGIIDGSLQVTDLTAGNLVVNGAGRFVNGIYGNLTGNVTGTVTGNVVGHASSDLALSGGTMTGRLTTKKSINQIITGSGTVGGDKGANASPRYLPSKWTFNTGMTATDGDSFIIKIPVAGHDYGVYISIDNGAHYHPVVLHNKGRLTTHYPANMYIHIVFEGSGSADSMVVLAGVDTFARTTVTGGVWRVLNYYDTNTYPSALCGTAAGTAAKGASCSNYVALAKSYIHVVMAVTNTYAGALTLNINGQGAKPIYINGNASSSSNYTLPAGSYIVYYNGTNYYFRTDGKLTTNGVTGHADSDLPLTGGTLTGDLIIRKKSTIAQNLPAKLQFITDQLDNSGAVKVSSSNNFIAVYDDHDAESNGTNMVIQSAGNIFIGGGEAPQTLYNTIGINNTGENLYAVADGAIFLETNTTTIGNRLGFRLDTSLQLIPVKAEVLTDNVGSIGTSSYKWANVYATTLHGKLDSRTFTIGKTGKSVNWSGNVSWSQSEISDEASTSAAGWMSANDKKKLDSIQVNATTGALQALDIVAGSGIKITADSTTGQYTIANTHNPYPKSGGQLDGNITFNQARQIYWREGTYGDQFAIVPSFSGTDDANLLKIQSAVGGANTQPAMSDKITIAGKTGNTVFTGTVKSPEFIGKLTGNASTATEFSASKSVTLTGDTTGTVSSKAGWSVATTTKVITPTVLSNVDLNNYKTTQKVNFYYGGGTNGCTNVPIGNGTQFGMITYATASGHVAQEVSSFSSDTNKGKWMRFFQNNTWSAWEKFLTSVNYTSYTVTKTGSGASGTWGINISGNAASLSATLGVGKGGTGATTFTAGRFLVGNGTSAVYATGNILHYNNTALTINDKTVYQNGFRIWGGTYGNDTSTLKSGTAGVLSYGDGGPQITFGTGAGATQDGAIIFTDNDSAGTGVSWHFVSNQTDWSVNSKRFVAKTSVTIGANVPNTSYALHVNGSAHFGGSFVDDSTSVARFNAGIQVANASQTTGGVGLYNSDPNVYGIMFRTTANQVKHGHVQGDWATYLTMHGNATNILTRGWVFKDSVNTKGVASISGAGDAAFNGDVTIGTTGTNISGSCSLQMDRALGCLNFVFN